MRLNVDILQSPQALEVSVLNLKLGQIGRLTQTFCSAEIGDFILRTYTGFVNLNDPGQTWSGEQAFPFGKVRVLPSGTVISLQVQG